MLSSEWLPGVGQIKLPPGLLLIQKTSLGWVVSGGYGLSNGSSLVSSQDVPLTSRENCFDRLDDLLRRFWKGENCAEPIIRATKEELQEFPIWVDCISFIKFVDERITCVIYSLFGIWNTNLALLLYFGAASHFRDFLGLSVNTKTECRIPRKCDKFNKWYAVHSNREIKRFYSTTFLCPRVGTKWELDEIQVSLERLNIVRKN